MVATAQLEFQAVEPVASMERNGIKLNRRKWARLYRKAYTRHTEVEKQLHEMLGRQKGLFEGIGSEINLNSKNDVVAAYKRLGIELPTYDDGSGETSTESWKLVGIQDKHPSLPLLIEHRGLSKSLSSYGLNWFDHINQYTGRIHATFNPLGAKTSRFASYDPNLQNLKQDDEYRNCFEAEDGRTLVWADYSQMELREAAEFSGDEVMLEAFNSGLDFHKYTAALCYEKHYDDVTYEERSIIKNMNYLVTYGGSAWKLAQQAGITLERAEEVMAIYWTRFKRLRYGSMNKVEKPLSTIHLGLSLAERLSSDLTLLIRKHSVTQNVMGRTLQCREVALIFSNVHCDCFMMQSFLTAMES
jgi:DNA polymerase-1